MVVYNVSVRRGWWSLAVSVVYAEALLSSTVEWSTCVRFICYVHCYPSVCDVDVESNFVHHHIKNCQLSLQL